MTISTYAQYATKQYPRYENKVILLSIRNVRSDCEYIHIQMMIYGSRYLITTGAV